MNDITFQLINQLIAMHARSLPVYLSDAAPFTSAANLHAKDIVEMIAADQMLTVDKLADWMINRNQAVSTGIFPIEFTGYHDLSMEFLLDEMVIRQRRDVEVAGSIVQQLSNDPSVRPLAEEALGAAKGHLESLEELQRGAAV